MVRKPVPLVQKVAKVVAAEHKQGRLPKRGYCIVSQAEGTQAKVLAPRKAFTELSGNSVRGRVKHRRGRASYTNSGCLLCEKSLCDNAICWGKHLQAISST